MTDTRTNDEFRVACLGPEPEPVAKTAGFDHVTAARGDDGFDFIARADEGDLWVSRSGWGRDGWDLGDWPYVVVQTAQEGTGDDAAFLVRTRVEGDLDVWRFRTQEEAHAKVDHIAWWYWLNRPDRYFNEDVTREVMATDVNRFRGPFSWERLDTSDTKGT